MSIEVFFQIVEALAVVVGVGFAMIQVRQYRRDKQREAAMELLHAFQTPSFARALNIVYSMPDGLTKQEVEEFAQIRPILSIRTGRPRSIDGLPLVVLC